MGDVTANQGIHDRLCPNRALITPFRARRLRLPGHRILRLPDLDASLQLAGAASRRCCDQHCGIVPAWPGQAAEPKPDQRLNLRASRQAAPACGSDVGGRRVRADSAVVLGPGLRRETPFARCARSGQTVPASQRWKRAARASPGPALLAASHVATRGRRLSRGDAPSCMLHSSNLGNRSGDLRRSPANLVAWRTPRRGSRRDPVM